MYKAQKSPAAQHVGVTAFYLVVAYVCEDTLRHPPTRQYLSSCVEILGQVHSNSNACPVPRSVANPVLGSEVHMSVFLQLTFVLCAKVFIQGNADECSRVLRTILDQRRLCPLISPFFTPNAAPSQLVFLYQDIVSSLDLSSADVIFILLTKVREDSCSKRVWWTNWIWIPSIQFSNCISLSLQFDLSQWLNETHPVFSERTRLLELVHGALCVCGQDPEPEILIPFHLFTKHWTGLLRYHFPDHYSDCLRLITTSKCVSVWGLAFHTYQIYLSVFTITRYCFNHLFYHSQAPQTSYWVQNAGRWPYRCLGVYLPPTKPRSKLNRHMALLMSPDMQSDPLFLLTDPPSVSLLNKWLLS